jgi:prepilin-type N-terminal cleavage/methylation domain-containing protein
MEWNLMAMIFYRRKHSASHQQGGLTLIELMIAMVILAVGVVGSMALVVRAIGGDFASKQTSNSTVLAQTVTERIMAVPANNNVIVTITDCTPTTFNVSTSLGGAALTTSGDVDYTQAAVANYNMSYTDCDTSGRQAVYDVRWNVQAITNSNGSTNAYAKILTVSSQLKSAGNNRMVWAPVATIRTIVGQGT